MDRKGLFSIGEVSKLFHISVSSLRHYENVGLLHPEYISADTGYRYYGTEQFEVLNTIRYLRALDMPLAEIEDFLKKRDISNIEEKLMQQKKIVLEKQQEFKRFTGYGSTHPKAGPVSGRGGRISRQGGTWNFRRAFTGSRISKI